MDIVNVENQESPVIVDVDEMMSEIMNLKDATVKLETVTFDASLRQSGLIRSVNRPSWGGKIEPPKSGKPDEQDQSAYRCGR